MADIKTKDLKVKDIKVLDKAKVGTEKFKDNLVATKQRVSNDINTKDSVYESGSNTIIGTSEYVSAKVTRDVPRIGNKNVKITRDNIPKAKEKLKSIKEKMDIKKQSKTIKDTGKGIKNTSKGIKDSAKVAKDAQKVAQKSAKNAQRSFQMAKEATKRAVQTTKAAIKATISTVKAAIAGTKALISALIAGGWIVLVIILVVCMIGLLCSSIFGIFLSGSKTSDNAITMTDVIAECNQEFSNKLQTIQDQNPHDDYVLDGNMASWKDVLMIYTVKQSNGLNEQEVVTMDNGKKMIFKQIFWDMNEVTSEVKNETVTEQGANALEAPKQVQKRVLHIKITSKNIDEMKLKYRLNAAQIGQIQELSDEQYASLWNGVIYGADEGEYTTWRQKGATWSSIKIGNTTSTVGDIGCLVTSIAILIEKSGVSTPMVPFNPGTFVEALNTKGGFDNNGNLQYAAVNKAVPEFRYMGHVELRDKTREQKLSLISQYYEQGYYLTVEVKGATPGNQHWVAVNGVNGNNIIIVDPATNRTDMWSAYEWSKTSQFNYFKAN